MSHGNDALQPTTGGTVTVLFTDVVESTRLNQSLGDEQANVLRRETDSLCRAAVERNRGVELKGLGDGMFLAFQSARRAVRCAQEIQRALVTRGQQASAQTVQLRIGLHTGEVITEAGDLHGETVVIAARLEAAAAGGEILVCSAVYQVLGAAREDLEDRGERTLKGIDAPWRVYAFPWERTSDGPLAANLLTPFTGRNQELTDLRQLQDPLRWLASQRTPRLAAGFPRQTVPVRLAVTEHWLFAVPARDPQARALFAAGGEAITPTEAFLAGAEVDRVPVPSLVPFAAGVARVRRPAILANESTGERVASGRRPPPAGAGPISPDSLHLIEEFSRDDRLRRPRAPGHPTGAVHESRV